ncbi:MAG: efflux RND transporter periplasmic adaptor subunit [Spirochaetales bacterium]|nr:efflux RND transporter periplasmic adaptor subunit [Spirochaetales bacterium]
MDNKVDNNETMVRRDREKKLRRKKIRRTIITLLLIILVIVGIWIYNYRISKGVFPWQDDKSSSSGPVMSQTTIREETYVTSIDVSGSVVAFDTQKVQMRANGSVTEVYVKEGDRVKKGQLLATLDDSNEQYEVANLEKQLETAKMGGTTSARDIELMEMRLDSAKSKLDNMKAYADFDGVVVSVPIREGDYYTAGNAAITIIDDSKLKATVEVDEIDIQMVELGTKVDITSDSTPGQTIEGRVSYIPMVGRYTNQGIGVMDVEIIIDNPPESLKPGFSFGGTIEVGSEQKMLLVAQAAVTTSRGVSSVTKVMDDGSYQKVNVTVKYLGENLYQILGGDVKDGDVVVYSNSSDWSSLMGMAGGGPGRGF